jgi:hypothetical protein
VDSHTLAQRTNPTIRNSLMQRTSRRTLVHFSCLLALTFCTALTAQAQGRERELRVEVKDKSGRPVPDARVTFFLSNDSATTDSLGVAKAIVVADSVLDILVRKIGFEQRSARFRIGTAPAFRVAVTLGEPGQNLAEIKVVDDYPGEPWRPGFEQRKKRNGGGGLFRDISAFAGGPPNQIGDWFAGMPGVSTRSGPGGAVVVNRCRALGLWVDGQHLTGPGLPYRQALQTVSGQDVAAVELYTSVRPAQFTAQNEDCSMLIWTRVR